MTKRNRKNSGKLDKKRVWYMLLKPDLGLKKKTAWRVCITFLHAWFTNKIIIVSPILKSFGNKHDHTDQKLLN
jgi:hypothetical protein